MGVARETALGQRRDRINRAVEIDRAEHGHLAIRGCASRFGPRGAAIECVGRQP